MPERKPSRRDVLRYGFGLAGAALLPNGWDKLRNMPDDETTLKGGRFLTLNSVIRVNQIEIGRDHAVGADEAALHTPERLREMRGALEKACPTARMTWALSWLALRDNRPNYREIRRILREYVEDHGDEVTFVPGGFFAPMYNSREQVNRDLHEALQAVGEIVGGSYRPKSVVAGFLAAESLRFLAEEEGVHVCQGNIWSQYGIDNGDGDGSVSYPYYPSKEHFLKPAQSRKDFIDCVNLDGWTCDFLAARRLGFQGGFNSRLGVGPIETYGNLGPETGLKEALATAAEHFDAGFKLNGFAWIADCWELSLGETIPFDNLTRWVAAVRERWPNVKVVTQGEFGLAWRNAHHKNDWSYRFDQIGSGIQGSDADRRVRWFMNPAFRLALLESVPPQGEPMVIDFTRYDLEAREPADPTHDRPTRNWSLMNRINQKGTRPQDKPVPLRALAPDDLDVVLRRYRELKRLV
jgi:hypothetical protein